jgi:MFS family permease
LLSLKAYTKPLIAGIFIVFSCLGLARFAFGMVLPNMQLDLGMNATQAGIVGSANFLGYFAGLFVIAPFYAKFGPAKLISRALWTQALSMVLMAIAPHYLMAALFFSVTGFFGALANIGVMTYIAQVVPPHLKGRATGIVVAGIGLSIILSGAVVPLVEHFSAVSWRISWGFFAVCIACIGWFSFHVLLTFIPHHSAKATSDTLSLASIVRFGPFWRTGFLFFLFGMTAIMYMTFFVATAMNKWHVSTEISGTFWAILGLTSLFSGPIFGAISDRIGRYATLAILFGLQACAHTLLFLTLPSAWLFVSAALFGFSTWAVPSTMATLSSELFGASHTARVLGLVTLFFGVGQIVGPLCAGILTDYTGDFGTAFGFSSFFLVFASMFSWISKHKTKS